MNAFFFHDLPLKLVKELGDKIQFKVCGDVPDIWQQELKSISVKYWPLLKAAWWCRLANWSWRLQHCFRVETSRCQSFFGFPQERLYDRQRRRIDNKNLYTDPDVLISDLKALRGTWASDASRHRNQIRYKNGVHRGRPGNCKTLIGFIDEDTHFMPEVLARIFSQFQPFRQQVFVQEVRGCDSNPTQAKAGDRIDAGDSRSTFR